MPPRFPLFRALVLLLLTAFGSLQAARLEGIVSDVQSGQPLPGVMLTTNRNDAHVFTNEDGFYQIFELPTGPLLLTASLAGYLETNLEVQIQTGVNTLSLALVPVGNTETALVEGVVTSTAGIVIAGVHIQGPPGPTDEVVFTNESGYYSYLAFVGGGPFHAEHPQYQTWFDPFVEVGPGGLVYNVVMEPNGQGNAFLHGQVTVAGEGTPVAGAQIMVSSGNTFPRFTETGDLGFYELGNLQAGLMATVQVAAQGFEGWTITFELQAGENTLNVELVPGGEPGEAELSGIIRNSVTNARLGGVELVFPLQPDHPSVMSNDQGHFHAEGLMPGVCLVNAFKEGFVPGVFDLMLEPGENMAEVYLTPIGNDGDAASLAGLVLGVPDGQPVGGAEVRISRHNGTGAETFTNEDGHFALENLFAGTHLLEVTAEGFQHWSQLVQLAPGPNSFTIELTSGEGGDHDAFLSGTVTDASSGLGIEGVIIHLPGNLQGMVLVTDSNGDYSTNPAHPLLSGPATLNAEAPGYFPHNHQFFLEPGENVYDFQLTPLGGNTESSVLEGTVVDNVTGEPIVNACLSAPGALGFAVVGNSGEGGHFRLEGLASGHSELHVYALGYEHLFMPLFLQPGPNTIDVGLQTNDDGEHALLIEGTVYDMLTRQPVSEADVLLTSAGISWTVTTGTSGGFAFGPVFVNAPHATLRANAPGYHEQVVELNLHGMGHGGSDTLTVNLNLIPLDGGMLLGMLAGHVRTEDTGLPVFSMIEAVGTDPADPRTFTTWTGPGGHWSMSVPAGSYYLLCHTLSGGNNTPVDYMEFWDNATAIEDATIVEVAQGSVQDGFNFGIPRTDGGQIEVQLSGRVTDDQQQGLPGVTLRFWTPDGELIDARVDTDETGHWGANIILDRLPIVPFSISAEHTSFLMEFFSNAGSFADATQFSFTSDATIANMNFQLAEAEEGLGSLSGQLVDENGSPRADGLVVALSPDNGTLMTVPTDLDGNYTLNPDNAGELALLYFVPGHMPVFSGESWSLEDAQSYSGNEDHSGLDMGLQSLPGIAGNSSVTGFIRNEGGQSLQGALLLAVSSDGQDMRYAMSGPQGSYRLEGLADLREYTLFCSLAGFHTTQAVVYTDQSVAYTRLMSLEMVARGTTAVDDPDGMPTTLALLSNWPNPFNPLTTLAYELDRAQHVSLQVYNIQGALVATLVDQVQPAGRYTLPFDASGLASGVYVYRLEGDGRVFSHRMLLLK